MADDIDTIPRSRVIELFDAIEAVLNPFERADLRARFQTILSKHNADQGAVKLLVDHDAYFELYDDVGTALERMPSPESNAQQQQEPVPPTPAPRQPRPLLAPDKTIRNANIWYSGGSGGGVGGGGGGSAMANVSQRSREDARIQMANAARAWQQIDGGSASYWNKLKTESGVAGNTNNADKKNANAAADDVSGSVPFDALNLNQSASYTPAARHPRPRPTSAFTPSSRSTRHTPNTRDTRVAKKKPQASRSRLPPPPSAAPPPPPPLHQNLQQLSNYIKTQAAEARARARQQREQREQEREQEREQPSAQAQAQSQKTLNDLDNDVIMRELRKRQEQRQMQNQFGKRLRR